MNRTRQFLIFISIAIIANSCSSEMALTNSDGQKYELTFIDEFEGDDWFFGNVPRDKIVPLKVVKQISFRPENEEPSMEYLNTAKYKDRFYVQNNYSGKITSIDMNNFDIEEHEGQYANAIYQDTVHHMSIDETGNIVLMGENRVFIAGEEFVKLQNNYRLRNFCFAHDKKIYSYNTSQMFSPGYVAFDIFDYKLNHLESGYENPLWYDEFGSRVASAIVFSRNKHEILMTSSCHQDVFLFDLNNKQQRKIRVKELPEYAEREEYNVKQVADKRPRIRFRNTYIAGDILDNELFLYAIGKKANYIVNLSKNGDLKRVYMLKILERPYLLYGMGVTRTKNDKPRMFLYYAAVKEDDSRVFPVCVLEPLE